MMYFAKKTKCTFLLRFILSTSKAYYAVRLHISSVMHPRQFPLTIVPTDVSTQALTIARNLLDILIYNKDIAFIKNIGNTCVANIHGKNQQSPKVRVTLQIFKTKVA